MENYKKYMLKCAIKSDECIGWVDGQFFFDTEEELIEFVKHGYKKVYGFDDTECHIKIESAFKLEKLDNSIFNKD